MAFLKFHFVAATLQRKAEENTSEVEEKTSSFSTSNSGMIESFGYKQKKRTKSLQGFHFLRLIIGAYALRESSVHFNHNDNANLSVEMLIFAKQHRHWYWNSEIRL